MHRFIYFHKLFLLFGFWGSLVFVFKYLFAGDEFVVSVKGVRHPVWLRKKEPDIHNLWQIFGLKECDVPELVNASAIADLGAYVGYSTLYLLNRFPDAHLYCVEPNPNNIDMFRRNVGKSPRVTLVQAAIYNSPLDRIAFNFTKGDSWSGSLVNANVNSETFDVPVLSFHEFMLKYSIPKLDLVKVDIEGAELELINEVLTDKSKVGFLLLELHGVTVIKEVSLLIEKGEFRKVRSQGEKLLLSVD